MVTLSSADKVLKNVYLEAICDQLNNKTNPFYAAIEKCADNVSGKLVSYSAKYGINGGMGSGTEDGALPKSAGNCYQALTAPLRNLYGTITLSDKVIRASRDSAGAVVDILNEEIEGLLDAAKFNFSRMLWQNGSGVLTQIGDVSMHAQTHYYPVASTENLMEGMCVDFVTPGGTVVSGGHRITRVDRDNNMMYIDPAVSMSINFFGNEYVTLQQSYNNEIYGIPYLFDSSISTFYGLTRSAVPYLHPQVSVQNGAISSGGIQKMLDKIEVATGGEINMLVTSYDVRREYLDYLSATRTNIDYMNLDGGFKALSYNGIPLVADRFCTGGNIYFLNTNDFRLAQLCDWQWIEGENGRILTQLEKTPTYTGTLVKYANLICVRPHAQGKLTVITIA
jgi:hypothetical protein